MTCHPALLKSVILTEGERPSRRTPIAPMPGLFCEFAGGFDFFV
jgi:hypothetical protein